MVPRVDDVEDLRATVARLAPACDVVLLYRAPVADLVIDLVREVAPSTQVVFLPVDLHHVRMAREAALSGADPRAAEHMRTLELDLVGRSNAVVVVSEVEHDLLRAAVPGARVTTVPILRETPPRTTAPVGQRRDVVFLGGFDHAPNVDAVHWFVGAVLPLVRDAGVRDRFVVAGYGVPESVAALARDDVVVVGHAPDLGALFATARMSVVPLRFGAGFKGKIVTSLSMGVPVVSTSIGTEGGGLVDEHDVLVADDPEGLARHIVRLSRDDDLWRRLSAASSQTFRARFSLETGGARLLSVVGEMVGDAGFEPVTSSV